MKLKEAFRIQNKLSGLYDEACGLLKEETFADKMVHHLYSKAKLGDDEKEVLLVPSNYYAGNQRYEFDKLIDLVQMLASEKEKLILAIEKSKMTGDMSFDVLKQRNVIKRQLIPRLLQMNHLKTIEVSGSENYYGKDNDGRQVVYHYPTKIVTRYNVDKNHLNAVLKKLRNECERDSLKIDEMMIMTEVEYTPPYDFDTTLEDLYLAF